MKALVLLVAAATMLAPTALAGPEDALADDPCVPNPEYSPWSDMVCCYVNLDFGPACTPP